MRDALRFLSLVLFIPCLTACGSDSSEDGHSAVRDGGVNDAGVGSRPPVRDDDEDVVGLLDAGIGDPDAGDGEPEPLANGEECTSSEECASGDCSESVSGTKYCYGTATLDEPCELTQDCAIGVCVESVCTDPATLLPNGSTCADSLECASLDCSLSAGGDSFCFGSVADGRGCAITQDCATGVCRRGICVDVTACASDAECQVNEICNDSGACEQACGFNAFAVGDSCECLAGFQWASNDASEVDCVKPTVLPGCHVFAQNNQQGYLGEVGDCVTPGSLCNPDGVYGSELADTSLFNPYGTFGSEQGAFSAFNPSTTAPPLMLCDGAISGCVTTNESGCVGTKAIAPSTLCTCP